MYSMDYDSQVESITEKNRPVLASFERALQEAGLSRKTVEKHLLNITFFCQYLTYYEPLKELTEADAADVRSFTVYWFPRKALWATETSVKENLASFKKFFVWANGSSYYPIPASQDVLDMLRVERSELIEDAVAGLI
jgi:site-specific recombinase XerD